MKKAKLIVSIVGAILLFCGSAFAQNIQNVIDFENMTVDVLADASYQTATPFFSGVVIETIDNVTGDSTGWPVVVRAYEYPVNCSIGIPAPEGTVTAFVSSYCAAGTTTTNYPVASGYNSLSDTAEGLPPVPGSPRKQDGFLISFGYPMKDFSVWFADWGDFFPNPNSVETFPSYIRVVAYDGSGTEVVSAEGPKLFAIDPGRDANRTNGIISLGFTGTDIREVEVRFMGKIDPGVAIDDIRFTGELDVDIKPGSFPNCFNSNDHGVIPIAILGSADFDVTIIDPLTIQLDGQAVRVKGKSGNAGSCEDVNEDGFIDLVVQILDDAAYEAGETTGTVTAQSYDGVLFEGQDSICITQ